MKYVISTLCAAFVGWPALIAGYAFQMAVNGFKSGRIFSDLHRDAFVEKFITKPKAKAGETKAPE